ncbi:hypothetical protein ACG7TL_000054 [Trametes sanguinea]
MSLNSSSSTSPNLYTVPKLAQDGSNWITYKERMFTVLGARGLMRHLLGTARCPPSPPPWPRIHPHIPTPPVQTSASSASRASGPTAAEVDSSVTQGTAAETAVGTMPASPFASLSDDEYLAKVESMEEKLDDFNQKEFATRQQIYSTISDALLLKVKGLESASQVWAAVSKEHEGKSEMYSNSIRTRLLNTRCAEGGDVREHVNTLLLLREELAAMGTPYPDTEFSATIFQSLPESYGTLLTALSTAARVARNPLAPEDIIFAVCEEYDRRKMSDARSGDAALLTARSGGQVECFNCKRKGHVKADCWRKGGGKEGQGPKHQMPRNRKKGKNGQASSNTNANAAVDTPATEEHAFAIALGSVAVPSVNSSREHVEVYDSGASRHIFPYRESFVEYNELKPPRPITAADGHSFSAIGEGSVRVSIPNGDGKTTVLLEKVLHAPEIAFALVSIRRADEAGYSAVFEKGECRIYRRRTGAIVGRVPLSNGLYQVRRPVVAATAGVGKGPDVELTNLELHRRLGHVSQHVSLRMVEQGRVAGIKLTDSSTSELCEACIKAKITRTPVPDERQSALAKQFGDRIHADTWSAGTISLGGNKYTTTWTDDATRWTETFVQKEKNQAFKSYKELEAQIEMQEGRRIKELQTDNGGEFCSTEFEEHLRAKGTRHRTSVHDTPEENGVAERVNRTLAEHARAMLADSDLPHSLWSYAMLHATWLKNRTATRALGSATPYEKRFGRVPDLRDLRTFGAKVWIRKEHAAKMESKAVEGRFVGYAPNAKGYRVYWPSKRSVSVERNVRFVEADLPLAADDEQLEGVSSRSKAECELLTSPAAPKSPDGSSEPPAVVDAPSSSPPPPAPEPPSHVSQIPTESNVPDQDETMEEAAAPDPALGRGQRVRKPSEYVRRLDRGEGSTDGRGSKRARGIRAQELMGTAAAALLMAEEEPGEEHDWDAEDDGLPFLFEAAMAIQEGQEPRSLAEAQASPDWVHWKAAIDTEIANLRDHDTYELVEPPSGVNIVGSRFVFRIKRDSDGSIKQYKARLVAQGFTQVPGLDYNETFAPVAKLSSIRMLLALAARYDWELEQMDVKSAYLNGKLDEEIFMRQPPGSAASGQEHLVCRLKKTLYGLKQAGRGWYKTLSDAMADMGLLRCASDHAVWYKHADDATLIVASSVDDLTITGTTDLVYAFKANISKRFEMSDLGAMRWILGIEVERNRHERTIAISQRAYLDTIIARFNLENANPVSTPLQPGSALGRHQSPSTPRQFEDMRHVPYREAVGSLMYAAMGTRPDITFAVTTLSQFMQNPGRPHWEALKHVLRYLKGTRELRLVYGTTSDGLQGFSDSDWGSSTEHRHSISGYVFTLDGGAISWSAKKQNVIALSSTEAEYIALTHAAKEALWLRNVLADVLDPDVARHPLTIYGDNRSAIALAKDNTFHPRTKHIDIRFHFIREIVDANKIALAYRRTEDMPADLFTKALTRARLEHLWTLFGLRSL